MLTGNREVEATVPGAGSVILNPSALPGELVERCRAPANRSAEEPAMIRRPRLPHQQIRRKHLRQLLGLPPGAYHR